PRSAQGRTSKFLKVIYDRQWLNASEFYRGIQTTMRTLEDLAMDAPQAPQLIGKLIHDLSNTHNILSSEQATSLLDLCPSQLRHKVVQPSSQASPVASSSAS